ncbi:MAG: acetyl-CoA carboxylase, carboxyltransferase subunit beta [Zhenhengia sp.]|jgi:acetyl-CoA carboxylase carboxyl transferase beta subunit|uniref:acetyl-CoA carboxylase, carboxyltransferase subunit beta n=1 Tax=Zhenhengia sp. TaxID=2944208 RepID=UPI002906368E|nr:acetyl-CoA carboxylase, carboxyltransferase subunit beta [Clostridiales bacterium]MDU6975373.1 acetyl-CoA carboxylase, carboxyltransferase subunit beta [Clostridiales bacterium]
MLSALIGRQKKYAQTKTTQSKPEVPKGMYTKCPHCKKNIYVIDLIANIGVCTYCNGHLPISPSARISKLIDLDSFEEFDKEMKSANPLEFEGYEDKIETTMKKVEQNEAVITGKGRIGGIETVLAVMDSRFIMGSMGSVVGEKITRAIEYATAHELPIIIFSASGGARMQEGIISLMQMAKTSAALARHDEKGLLYISVLTNPTTGGVTASFAMLGDIIIAEPNALIGFAGPRVIEQTIRQKLPQGFQRSEFSLEHGMIDCIVERKDMRDSLYKLLKFHAKEGQDGEY